MHKYNISFPYLISNKYLINLFDIFDKNLNVKSVYFFLSVSVFKNSLFPVFVSDPYF